MYVPATPLPAAPLAPVGIALGRPVPVAPGCRYTPALKVRTLRSSTCSPTTARTSPARCSKAIAPAQRRLVVRCRRSAGTAGGRSPARAPARTAASACATRRAASAATWRAAALRRRRRRAALAPPARQAQRLPPGRGLVVRRRRHPGLRRRADELARWASPTRRSRAARSSRCATAGASVRVPVVDRGPYVAGREFDLTEATKDALGFGGVGQVWSTS